MSDNSDAGTVNVKGIENLLKALKGKPPKARVGVLGSKVNRGNDGSGKSQQTNADIGARHEFGLGNMPQRSFLRVPIAENLDKYMANTGFTDEESLKQVIKDGSLKPWLKQIAVLAEAIVSDAFDSGGFGKWPAWKTPGYTNQANQILVDTQQLRNSITSEVK